MVTIDGKNYTEELVRNNKKLWSYLTLDEKKKVFAYLYVKKSQEKILSVCSYCKKEYTVNISALGSRRRYGHKPLCLVCRLISHQVRMKKQEKRFIEKEKEADYV